jgi:predicted nucleic acid-binding protein
LTYLLDTDWLIDYLHGRADAVSLVEQLAPDGLAVSAITYAEFYEGIILSPRREQHLQGLDEFVSSARVLDVDQEVARIFGEQRAALRKAGRLIDNFGLLIAATALRFGLTLVTRNVRDFGRIDGLAIYSN